MITHVLDASVAIAWYIDEAHSHRARRWQAQCLDSSVTFLVPSLHYWEVANALRTYVRRGVLDDALACDIYQTHVEAPLVVMEPARDAVLDVTLHHQMTAYDAVYASLALEQGVAWLTAEKTARPWFGQLGDAVCAL
jgi:predicted nucleic acid-binding protein